MRRTSHRVKALYHSKTNRMNFNKSLFLLMLPLALSFAACEDDDDTTLMPNEEPITATGFTYVEDDSTSITDAYNGVKANLEAAGPIGIIAEVNHGAAATNAGLSLRPTRVILFGNPNLGTPLMQQNILAGLDLPQKIVFYQQEDNDVIVGYNSTEYLASRHNLTDNGELTTVGNALKNFVESNTSGSVRSTENQTVDTNEGIVLSTTPNSVDSVYNRLRTAIAGNANLTIVAELDHSANAERVGLTLPASKLIVFGNPAVGSPFMQDEQSAAIDLPVKILVYDNGSGTTIAYNAPAWLAGRHGIDENLPQIATMRMALENLTNVALGN